MTVNFQKPFTAWLLSLLNFTLDLSSIMYRAYIFICLTFIASISFADDAMKMTGEVTNITTHYIDLVPNNLSSPLEEDYTLIELANGHIYQLGKKLKAVSSSTIVELDIVSSKTASGYPLVESGRTISLVTTINGTKTLLPLETPREF